MYKEMRYLTDAEFMMTYALLEYVVAGKRTLADIFGEFWEHILRKTSFGRRFKRTVEAGFFDVLTLSSRTVQNHQLYIVRLAIA